MIEMFTNQLYDKIKSAIEFGTPVPDIPEYITDNLKYEFFEWQREAFEYFLLNEKKIENSQEPTHLMFNMATGTGKTLLMAAAILYYYKQGYRHFLFFVNQNNIIDKTENNFIDSSHTKYLFNERIVIEDKTVDVFKVDTFSDSPRGIEIKFTSIHKLHNDIHIERENQTSLDDLNRKDIVMLADEAHHFNADTKNKKNYQTEILGTEITNKTSKDEIERKGWEHTVIELILKKNGKHSDNKNVLLEFTATIPETASIAAKYEDKTIYKFDLKAFLLKGYTKEINLISSSLNKKERILQALLFAWYRHKIALKHGIPNFKPVMLFRSKLIEESRKDYEDFMTWADEVSSSDFDFLKTISDKIQDVRQPSLYEMGKSRTEQVLEFIKKEKIKFEEIAYWIRNNYQEKNVIITNSKTNKNKSEKTDEETEKLLNSLEDKNNHVRAIFTVDRLTEGWDVLNLYDIVRLYQEQPVGGDTKKTPEATIKEKQLIGRGVRYYPFSFEDKIKNKRKFDKNLDHELRVLEELYYYTYDEKSRYISHLKAELKKDGYIRDDRVLKTFKLKKEFKDSDFYKKTKIWYNKQKDNPERQKKTLDDLKDVIIQYKIKGLEFSEQEIAFDKEADIERINLNENVSKTITKEFKDIEKHIVLKAINIKAKQDNSLFRFENLKRELEIDSIEELQTKILADFQLQIIVNKPMQYDDIDNTEKLNWVLKFLDYILKGLKESIAPYIGSEFVWGEFKKFFATPKTKSIEENYESQNIEKELKDEKWYVLDSFHGTSEEIGLIQFIQDTAKNIEGKYEEFYLLRNEEVYKIYDFEQGRGYQPDFLLFLRESNGSKNNKDMYYQVFIEPKGKQFIGNDGTFETGKEGWKEQFLNEISDKYGDGNILKAENKDYKLFGLPFYNKDFNNFEKEFKSVVVDY